MRWLAVLLTFLVSLPASAGVVWVPSSPLVGDGSTSGTVRFYVDDGQKIKVKADSGKVGPAVPGADGVWTIPYTPPRVSAAGTVSFKIVAGGVESSFEVPVAPPVEGSVTISFDPPELASTATATVKIVPTGTSPIATDARRFLLVASAGTIEALTPTGGGAWVARYTPPKGLTAPLSVVFGAADAAAPDLVSGTAVLPVTVKRSVTLDVGPGSSNVLRVGTRTYGPLVAAPSGKVAFDIDLDPREPKGDLRSVNADTSKVDKEVDLPLAASTSLTFLPLPASIPAQADLSVPVRIVVVNSDGSAKTVGADVKLTASAGSITTPVLDRSGYTATFTPPTTPGVVTLTAEIDGQKAERKIQLIGSVPSVTLSAADITKTGTTFTVTARVKDGQGTGVIGKAPVVTAEGANASGSPKDNKDGSYTFAFKVSSSTNQVRVSAAPAVEVSSMPASRIVAWPASPFVNANGTDTLAVTVLTVDVFGVPVPNVELKLGAPRGDGSVPPAAKTDTRGMARVTFTAGRTPGVASVRVEGGGLVTEVPLFQTDAANPGVMLPLGGGAVEEALSTRWQAAAPVLKVLRDGVVPPTGPPALVALTTVPPYTTPGAAILLNVRVTDSVGAGVGGKKLAISASPAAVGQITDNRDGTYAVALQLPAGVDGPVTISVGADAALGSTLLPTLAQVSAQSQPASSGPGPRQANTGGSGGGSTAKVRAAPSPAQWSKLRLGGALVNARGTFTQESDGGAQLLGAASYATPGAGFWGVGVEGVWLPVQASFGGLGVDFRAKGQLEWFNVGNLPYINVQRDIVLGARYRRALGGLFSFEGTLAGHYTTGVLFRYADAARAQAELLNFPLFGARLGVLASLESEKVYASVEFAETFAPFPIDTHAEAIVDYRLGDGPAAVRVGGTWDYRTMTYAAEGSAGDSGSASVQQMQFGVRAGMAVVF